MSQVLRELLYGKHAYADALASIDVPPEIAGRLPEWASHSIWQLVWHVDFWMDYELNRLAGTPVPYPEHAALSWPPAGPPDAPAWEREKERFSGLLRKLAEHAARPADQLAREVPRSDPGDPGQAASQEAVLWQTVVHNAYHLGQVVVLRRALNAWPPSDGSDTW